jgi:hypothetical protein
MNVIERADANGVIHQFPIGTPESVIQKVTGNAHTVQQKPVKTEPFLPNALGSFVQGASMGFSDEAIAKARSLFDKDPNAYNKYLQAERQGMSQYNREHPYISTASEFAGSLVPTIAATALTGGAAAPEMAALNAGRFAQLGKTFAPALYGGVQGAITGAGTSESDRLKDAGYGALGGAAAGQLFGVGSKYLKSGWDAVKVKFGLNDPSHPANLAIATAMQKDGYSPQSAAQAMELLGRGELTLADLGENTRLLLKKSTQAPGNTRNQAIQYVAERNADKVPRVSDDLQKLMSGSQDFYTDLENMKLARKNRADPLYKAAYENADPITPDTTEHLNELSKAPSFQEAMRAGMKRAADQGIDLSDPKNILRGLHETKIALDDMIASKMRAGETNQARTLIDMQKRLVSDMENSSPDYKLARQAYAGDSEVMNAAENGKNIYNMSEPEMRKLLLTHVDNPSELDAMRSGIAQAMLEKLRASPDARPIRSVLGGDMEDKIKLAFHDDNAFNQFKQQLMNEEKMMLTQKQGISGAPVEPTSSAEGVGNVAGAAADLATGKVGVSTLKNLYNTVEPAMTGMPASVAAPTAERLLTPVGKSGTGLDPVLEGIMQSLKAEEDQVKKYGLGGYLGKTMGGLGGQMMASKPSISGGMPDQQEEPPAGPLGQASAPQPEAQPQQ